MSDKTISNLTAAEQLYLSDLLVIDQNGTAKKLTGDTLKTFVETYSGGGGGGGGTTNYNELSNRPQINSTTLTGNKSASDLGLASASHTHTKSQITDFPSNVSAFNNDAGYVSDISGKVNEPSSEGTAGQVLTTDGNGGRTWTTVSGGGGGGTTDYPALSNKPQINGTTLTGNKTAANLGLAAASHSHSTSDITGLENYVNGLIDVKLGVIEDADY